MLWRVLKAGASVFYHLPAGSYKNKIRSTLIRRLNIAPREVLIDRGETAVMVGSPNPRRLHQFARSVGDHGRVLFVEPEPSNYNSLNEAAKKYSHASVDKRGAWSERGTQTLQLGGAEYPADHKIPVEGVKHDNDYREENYKQAVDIDVAPLDEIINDIEIRPDYVEIMVNGAELEVLKGANQMLREETPKLWIKGHALVDSGEPINKEIVNYLADYGYHTAVSPGGDETVGETGEWEKREGDVFGWK